jgi:hypothetical protein
MDRSTVAIKQLTINRFVVQRSMVVGNRLQIWADDPDRRAQANAIGMILHIRDLPGQPLRHGDVVRIHGCDEPPASLTDSFVSSQRAATVLLPDYPHAPICT